MYKQILDRFEQLLQQEITNFGVDFGRDEQAVWKTILALGHAALQRMVDRQRNGYHGSCIRCACGGWMKFVQHRSREIHSFLGWIELKRAHPVGCEHFSPLSTNLFAARPDFWRKNRPPPKIFSQTP